MVGNSLTAFQELTGETDTARRRTIAVIGGGAAGTISAVHLLRQAAEEGIDLVLIDREGDFGPGLPYRTRDPLHVLNVPASRMGAISGYPEHFHRWLWKKNISAGPESFMPRSLFGDYLRELLAETEEKYEAYSTVEKVVGEVTSVAAGRGSRKLGIGLADGSRLEADGLVLAIGHLPSGEPVPVPPALKEAGLYVGDPWKPGALDRAANDRNVLILGTGLTMVDIAASLGKKGGPQIRAVSRHGLLPRRHRKTMTNPESFPLPEPEEGIDRLIESVFDRIERVRPEADWRDVIDSLRTPTPEYWRRLPLDEKRRFVSDVNRFWDVHRFRIAPAVADRLEGMLDTGRLEVAAGSIVKFEPSDEGAAVTIDGSAGDEVIQVDRIINCTGAGVAIDSNPTPLLADLFASGIARPDDLRIGLEVSREGRLIGSSGREAHDIQVVGGLRKGVEWEAIGVTEIRDHAAGAARILLGHDQEEASLPAYL